MGAARQLRLSVERKTVIRGGYGLFYFPQGNAGTNIRQFRQPPFDFVVNLPFSGNDIPTTTASQGFPDRHHFSEPEAGTGVVSPSKA